MNKKDYCEAIGNRILTVMNNLGMKQKDLLELAEVRGYGIKQAVLSKICNGTLENPSIMTLVQIADILNIDFNELFSLDLNIMPSSVIQKPSTRDKGHEALDNQFITNPNDVYMKPYLNSYHAYFLPTKSDEYTPLHGLLTFKCSDDNERVIADFCFKTGKRDGLGGEIEKRYKGEMVISPHMSAVYCWLRNDEIGEISYIMFHYIPITYERLFSRLGLVITSCAGNPRVPTAQRIIISVPEIKQEDLDIIQGQLYMNTREILISELGMEKMLLFLILYVLFELNILLHIFF